MSEEEPKIPENSGIVVAKPREKAYEKRVLVVDDDADFRQQIAEYLEENDLPTRALESGNHALRYIKRQSWSWYPRLVITDLVMPGMGGYELVRRVNEMYPDRSIPIIVVSQLGMMEDVAEAEVAGASGYIRKPCSPEQIMKALHRIAEAKRKRQSVFFVER